MPRDAAGRFQAADPTDVLLCRLDQADTVACLAIAAAERGEPGAWRSLAAARQRAVAVLAAYERQAAQSDQEAS